MKKEIELNIIFEEVNIAYERMYYYNRRDKDMFDIYCRQYYTLKNLVERLEITHEYRRWQSAHGINPYRRGAV